MSFKINKEFDRKKTITKRIIINEIMFVEEKMNQLFSKIHFYANIFVDYSSCLTTRTQIQEHKYKNTNYA